MLYLMLHSHLVWYLIPFEVIGGGITKGGFRKVSKVPLRLHEARWRIELTQPSVIPSVSYKPRGDQHASDHDSRQTRLTRRWMMPGVFDLPVSDASIGWRAKVGMMTGPQGIIWAPRQKSLGLRLRHPRLIISMSYYVNKPRWNTVICPWLRPRQH